MVFTRIVVKTEESQAGPARARGNGKHINLLTREFRQTVALYGSRLLEIAGEENSEDWCFLHGLLIAPA